MAKSALARSVLPRNPPGRSPAPGDEGLATANHLRPLLECATPARVTGMVGTRCFAHPLQAVRWESTTHKWRLQQIVFDRGDHHMACDLKEPTKTVWLANL
jgi:hypothetical protein